MTAGFDTVPMADVEARLLTEFRRAAAGVPA